MPYLDPVRGVALRAFAPEDAPALLAYLNDPALEGRRYVPDGFSNVAPLSARHVEGILDSWHKDSRAWTLAVVETESGALVGHARADWEWDPHCPTTSVVIAPSHHRRGLGSSALAMALDFLFGEVPAHVVNTWAASWNAPALAFALRNGFREAGRRPRSGFHAGQFCADVAFDLLRSEWKARKGGRHGA